MAKTKRPATARDMFLTMAVLMLPVILLVVWTQGRTPDLEPEVPTQNWEAAVRKAVRANEFEVLAPPALPAGWRATKARWMVPGESGPQGDPVPAPTLELGFLGPENTYVALNETIGPKGPYLERVSRSGIEEGKLNIEGTSWVHLVTSDGRTHTLHRSDGQRTVALVSDAGVEVLVMFAGLLTPSS